MIKLGKRPNVPPTLTSKKVCKAIATIRKKVRQGSKPENKDFPSYWLEDDVRMTLWEYQQHKCCYCERTREAKREPDIEHFRPKGSVVEETKKHKGYWWLAYDWSNLFFSCRPCNQEFKKNHFPLMNLGKRAYNEGDSISNENPVFINPEREDPSIFITYQWEDQVIPLARPAAKNDNHRGRRVIRMLGLDRDILNEERGRLLLFLRGIAAMAMAGEHSGNTELMKSARERIRIETSSRLDFAAFRREFFTIMGLGSYVSKERGT